MESSRTPDLTSDKTDLTSLTNGASAMSHALRGLSTRPPINREDSWNPNTSSRALDVDGVLRSKKQNEEDHGIESRSRSTTAIPSDDSGSETHVEERQRNRRKSIEVVLEKSGKKGEYKFTAKDPEFQEVLQTGLRREAEKLNRKNKGRPRDLIFTQQFTTFDRQNVTASQSPFRGFFTLFWLAMAILLIRIAAGNYRTTGSIFGNAEILHLMVDKELFVMLATDLGMCATTVFGFFLQKAIAKDYLTWNGSGWIVQSLWQAFFTFTFIWITFWREWPWTHTVFIVLHVFVLLMKQHAYAFYNGYLSRVYRRRNILQDMLRELDAMKSQEGSTETTHLPEMSTATNVGTPNEGDLTRRGRKYSPQLSDEELEIAGIGQAIDSGKPLDSEQIEGFRRVLNTEITILNEDLRGKCTTTDNIYPNNLKFYNFLEWSCFPTLVYDLEYPRQDRINWWYVAEKSAATLGGIWVMIIISQAYIYPVVVETVRRKEAGMSLDQGWKEFPWIVSDMVFPMLLQSLLSFYVIWECLLNVLAELTRFADRGFYGPWWNSISFDQYARDWNRPVHNFLLRHVYHSSISFFHMSRMQATFFTFFLSAVVHEVVMFCLFKKVRGYLFAFQLTQIPQAAFCKSRFMKGRDTLGNVIFWFGIFIGPSLIMGLYLIM